ncbi:MAG: acetate--CoA ligase alpha subunit [bacterium]
MLNKFFSPKSVVLVGASREQGKVGHEILKNLILGGYKGLIYPINPKAANILGRTVYKSIPDIPVEEADLAIIVIPAPYVKEAVIQCAQKHIQAAIVVSAGFKESGTEGAQRERELIQVAQEYGIKILGPNCLGLINTSSSLNASFSTEMPPKGNIAFFSQSGALGTAILDWAVGQRIGFSKFISLGNKADISETDILEALCLDSDSKVILGYLEGIEKGREFLHKAREVSKVKPIIITKSGSTSAGTRAASSHTGSLTGSDVAFDAAFKQGGIIRAKSIEELFNYALAFAYQPLPKGANLVVLTNAGGPGILAADAAEKNGLNLSSISKETTDKLTSFLPHAASVYNPVDILGDAKADRYQQSLEALLEDTRIHGALVILTPQAMTEVPQTAELIGEVSLTTEKPILTSFMGEYAVKEGIDRLAKYKIPNYSYPEHAVESFRTMYHYRAWQEKPPLMYTPFEGDKAKVHRIISQNRDLGYLTISDLKAREILSAYQFEVPVSKVAETSFTAVELAEEIGYPVVMKIDSPDILHKSDVGGVRVGLSSPEEVQSAFHEIIAKVKKFLPQAVITGVALQKMYAGGREVILGLAKDPQFGPMIMFGLGGIYVEVLKDVSFRIAPICREEALAMVTEIKSYPLLKGVRGQKSVDMDAIVDALLRLSQLATDFPEILEADINPLIVRESGEGAVAVDARFTISPD